MDKVTGNFFVLFEDPFWIAVFERVDGGELSACKVTFGAEPKDQEILDFLMENYFRLRFSPSVETKSIEQIRRNPKRQQRIAKRQMETIGIGTKAQQALKLQRDQGKQERKQVSREQKELEERLQFERKKEKRKQKHKGR